MYDQTQGTSGVTIKLAYGDFISTFPWDVYSTITFRQKRTDALFWAHRFWQTLERFNASRAIVAVEPHRYEGIHLHSLSRHPEGLKIPSLWKYCFKAYGRSTIDSIEGDQLAVSAYCAKYVVKGNYVEFLGDSGSWKGDY